VRSGLISSCDNRKLLVSSSPSSIGLAALNIEADDVEILRLDLMVDVENPLVEDTAIERRIAIQKGFILDICAIAGLWGWKFGYQSG